MHVKILFVLHFCAVSTQRWQVPRQVNWAGYKEYCISSTIRMTTTTAERSVAERRKKISSLRGIFIVQITATTTTIATIAIRRGTSKYQPLREYSPHIEPLGDCVNWSKTAWLAKLWTGHGNNLFNHICSQRESRGKKVSKQSIHRPGPELATSRVGPGCCCSSGHIVWHRAAASQPADTMWVTLKRCEMKTTKSQHNLCRANYGLPSVLWQREHQPDKIVCYWPHSPPNVHEKLIVVSALLW